jgi:hypothetical protein
VADLGAAAAHAEIEDVGLDAAEEIARLAGLSEIEYERQRPQSAKVLQMRAPVLDRLVQKERKALDTDDDGKQGRRLDLPDTEPWHEPVRGDELVEGLCDQIKRYVVLGDHAALAVACGSFMPMRSTRPSTHRACTSPARKSAAAKAPCLVSLGRCCLGHSAWRTSPRRRCSGPSRRPGRRCCWTRPTASSPRTRRCAVC